MISKHAAALAALLILMLTSCNWFKSSPHTANDPLSGKWKLDSINSGNKSDLFLIFALASLKGDSSATDIEFRKDSLFSFDHGRTDTSLYRIREKEKQLIVRGDSDEIFSYERLNDSSLRLIGTDSTVLYLRKQ